MQLNDIDLTKIRQAFESIGSGVAHYDVPIESSQSLLADIESLGVSPLLYFSTPGQETEQVGIGKWAEFNNAEAELFLKETHGVQLFGGNVFNAKCHRLKMPTEYWVLPVCILVKNNSKTMCRIIFDKRHPENSWETIQNILDEIIHVDIQTSEKKPVYSSVQHEPVKNDWLKKISHLKGLFESETIQKVVLARKTTVNFPNKVNPFSMVRYVQQNDPDLYHFVFRLSDDCTFIGGTPERLFEIYQGKLASEALAGTVRKEDYNDTFINQEKENIEHKYVADFITSAFDRLCDNVKTTVPKVLPLKYLYHLIQPFTGVLKSGVGPIHALTQLHPTPAVAGTPTKKAISCIAEYETFSREWYAGPIGVLSDSSSIVVVAIRSGIVEDSRVYLYAGAGIIEASDPEKEWEELNTKLVGFTRVFQA